MKIKKTTRYKVSMSEHELLTMRAALNNTINHGKSIPEGNIQEMTLLLKELRFE